AFVDVVALESRPGVVAGEVPGVVPIARLDADAVVAPLGELVVVHGIAHVRGDVVGRDDAQGRRVDFGRVEVVPVAANGIYADESAMADLRAVAEINLVDGRGLQRSLETATVARIADGEEVSRVVRAADAVEPVEERRQSGLRAHIWRRAGV